MELFTPLVSVLMITYNHEQYIRQALESVFTQQTEFEFEVVIGEDCSTDNTRSIIREFEAKYPDRLFPVYHTKNVGMIRNSYEFCYPKLRGKYAAFLEGDDFWTDPQKLQKQVDFLEQNPSYSLCYHSFGVINERDIIVDLKYLENKNVAPPDNRCDLEYYLRYKNIKTLTVVFRMSSIVPAELHRVMFDSPAPTSGDIPLFFLLLSEGDGFFLNEIMGVYRLHSEGITNKKRKTNDPVLITTIKIFNRLSNSKKKHFLKGRLIEALKSNLAIGDIRMSLRIARALMGF